MRLSPRPSEAYNARSCDPFRAHRCRRASLSSCHHRVCPRYRAKTLIIDSVKLNDSVDLDGEAQRDAVYTDRGPGMDTAIAKDVDHQIGTSIDDLWNLDEVRPGLNKPAQAKDATKPTKVALGGGLDLRDEIDAA
jgi:hypothetical protein